MTLLFSFFFFFPFARAFSSVPPSRPLCSSFIFFSCMGVFLLTDEKRVGNFFLGAGYFLSFSFVGGEVGWWEVGPL